jgi:hypothetical protein
MDRIDSEPVDSPIDFTDLSEDELAELALAADPNAPLAPDAVPWIGGASSSIPLPAWYMPPAVAVRHGKGTRAVVAGIIFGFLVIDACGLCITSGFLTFA